MPFSAVLDACVLYPAPLRDTLLRVALVGLYQPLWSEKILEEVARVMLRYGYSAEKSDRLAKAMSAAFEDSMVIGWEPLESAMRNDPKDRHVLAAAVRAGADVIVTSNLKDFPLSSREPYGIEAQSPDVFLCYQLDLSPARVVGALREQAKATGRHGYPERTVGQILRSLTRCGVNVFVEQVEAWLGPRESVNG